MRRHQLEHAIRAACHILGGRDVIIVGSQAILGSIHEDDLPAVATYSREVDILPVAASAAEVEALADKLVGVAGELSAFDSLHGFYVDGVGLNTCILPDGWRDRLVRVSNRNTAAPGGEPKYTGWCLNKEDLCVEKLYAHREKDLEFVGALIRARLVDPEIIVQRLAATEGDSYLLGRATDFATAAIKRLSARALPIPPPDAP